MAMAFIVDGVLEKKVVQALCAGCPVRMTNMNGRSVAVHALARAISALIEVFSDRHYPIVIIVDREQRKQASLEIEEELEILLAQSGHNVNDLIIACPDRMIENWICAGSDTYRDNRICEHEGADFDGLHGKNHLKAELYKHKIFYRETTVGVEMFTRMKHPLAVGRSASYSRFAQRIKGFCPKLQAALT